MKDLKKYIGWAILGFFFPIVGLILFIVWRETEKEKSKVTLMGTLIGVGIYFIITIFATILLLFIVPKMDSRKVIYNNNNNNNNNNNKNNNISNEDPTACTGNFKKDGYKYEIDYLDRSIDNSKYNGCETISYKLNGDYTIEVRKENGSSEIAINGNLNEDEGFLLVENPFYIVGKTLIVSSMHQTTVNGNFSVTLFNTKGVMYNFSPNPNGYGRDTNLINTEGRKDHKFEVDKEGNLVVIGRVYNELIDTDYLGTYGQTDITCNLSVSEVAKAYNLKVEDAFDIAYTYKLKDDGLIDFNYSSKKTYKTINDAYNEFCQKGYVE